jgi:3-hydroxymyristoyl/3-hydroxydecanoyl-(acyl carrier protein) dehydratase
MPDRFSAFSFVDRITALEDGRRARGRFAIPARLPGFSTCLVVEAVGQLAAWVAMAQADFRRRPVAALGGETRIVGEAAPGEILDLGVEIESCDADAVVYEGWARVADTPVLELSRCVGPMLPLEDFDAPEAVRGDFETLCGPGKPSNRFPGISAPDLSLIDRIPGQRLRAAMHVPLFAPFFGDHFRCGSRERRCLQANASGPLAWPM